MSHRPTANFMANDEKKADGTTGNSQRPKPPQDSSSKFKAPTPGYEDVTFDVSTSRSASAAATFENKVDGLASYVAILCSKTDGADAALALRTLTAPKYEDPGDLDESKATFRQKKDFEAKYSAYERGTANWTRNNKIVYNLFWSHCTDAMKTKLAACDTWEDIATKQNGLKLVELIKKLIFDVEATGQTMLEMVQADKELFTCFQRNNQSLDDYVKMFKARAEIAEAVGSKPAISRAATTVVAARDGLTWDAVNADAGKQKEYTKKLNVLKRIAAL